MKRFLVASALLFLCLTLGAAELKVLGVDAVPPWVATVIGHAANQALIPRLPKDGILQAAIESVDKDNAKITFVYGSHSFVQALPLGNLDEDALLKLLVYQLANDGTALLDLPGQPYVSYVQDKSYLASEPLKAGQRYWALDGQGNKRGSAIVNKAYGGEDPPVALLSQTSGSPFLVGMPLVAQKPMRPSLSVTLNPSLDIGIEALASFDGVLPSFGVVASVGALLSSGSLDNIHAMIGLNAELPFSQLLGHGSMLWRNLSLKATALAGLGFSPTAAGAVVSSEFSAALAYHVMGFGIELLGGNRIWVDGTNAYNQGLFLGLGTSYTW